MGTRAFALTISILAMAVVGTTPSWAAPAARPWVQQAPLPTADNLWDVDMVSASEGWAVGDNGRILYTTNGGATWRMQRSGTTAQLLAVHFLDAVHGWAVGANTALYTTNGGGTWQKSSSNVVGSLNNVGFKDLTTGFITWGLKGMYKSTNGGKTWTLVSTPFAVAGIQFFDANDGVISGNGGVMHTSDGGASWDAIAGPHGGFFIDHDRGWYALNDQASHTVDGGATWVSETLPSGIWVQSGALFPDAQNGWAAGESQGIAHTSDGGQTWVKQFGASGSFYDRYRLWDVDFGDALHGIVVGEFGTIFVTSDGGTTWTPGINGSGTETFDLDATDTLHAWASQAFGEVLYTTDGGIHWNRTNPAYTFSLMHGVDFIDSSMGWVVGEDYGSDFNAMVYRSTDGGRSWQFQWSGGDVSGLFDVAAVDAQRIVAVGYQGIYRSVDGGATWQLIKPTSGVMQAVKFYGNTGWAVGTNNVWKSTDGGATWTRLVVHTPFEEPWVDVSFAPDLMTGWAVGFYGVVMRTTDGGATWKKQSVGVGQTTVSAVSAVSATHAWISGGSGPYGGDPFVKHTTDGGTSWLADRLPMDARNTVSAAAFLSPTYGWVGGSVVSPGGGIWRYSA